MGLGNPETLRFSTLLNLGEALTWYGDLEEARQVLGQFRVDVERVGTPNGRALALTALAVTAWRQGDVELVRELAPQARAAARRGQERGTTGTTWRQQRRRWRRGWPGVTSAQTGRSPLGPRR